MLKYTTSVVLINLALFLCSAMIAPAADSAGLIMRGTYDYTINPDDPKPRFSARYNFEVTVSSCSWIISYEDLSAATNADILNVKSTASCDGTNIYVVRIQSENAVKKAWGNRFESVKNDLPTATAEIFPGIYPPPDEFVLQKIWFAFASSCVFSSSGGREKPPYGVDLAIFYNNTNFYCDYFWTSNENQTGSRQIILMSDGYTFSRDEKNGELRRVKYAPPYDKGFTNAIGYWSQGRNIAGLFCANEFEFTEFGPKIGARNSADLLRHYTYKCIVTNVRTATIDLIPAKLPDGKILVTDRRFEKEGYSKINYLAPNGWIAADDPFVASRLKNSQKSTLENEAKISLGVLHPDPEWKRWIIWLLVALPLSLLFLKGLLEKQKNKPGKKHET